MAFPKVTSACDEIVGFDRESEESCLSSEGDYSPFSSSDSGDGGKGELLTCACRTFNFT